MFASCSPGAFSTHRRRAATPTRRRSTASVTRWLPRCRPASWSTPAIYYYRTRNAREVDFIVDFIVPKRGQPPMLIHACGSRADPQAQKRAIADRVEAMDERSVAAGTIVTCDEDERVEVGCESIEVASASRYLLEWPEVAGWGTRLRILNATGAHWTFVRSLVHDRDLRAIIANVGFTPSTRSAFPQAACRMRPGACVRTLGRTRCYDFREDAW